MSGIYLGCRKGEGEISGLPVLHAKKVQAKSEYLSEHEK